MASTLDKMFERSFAVSASFFFLLVVSYLVIDTAQMNSVCKASLLIYECACI